MVASVNRKYIYHVSVCSGSNSDSESDDEADHIPVTCKPAVCKGRQPDSDVYVLGPEIQFWSDGKPIPLEEQQYVWITHVLKRLHMTKICVPQSPLPSVRDPLKTLMKNLNVIMGANWISATFMLGECYYT